jgi:hypothetical protein
MVSFKNFILLAEGVNVKLAVDQLTKFWKSRRIPEAEIQARLSNQSTPTQGNNSSDSNFNVDNIVKLLSDADPTQNKEFFQWLLAQYIKNTIRLPEDNFNLHNDLSYFVTIKKNGVLKRLVPQLAELQVKNPMDITSYDRNKLSDLIDLVKEKAGDDPQSNRQKAIQQKINGAKRLYKDEEWELMEITEGEAACHYAKGTRWCTSNANTANSYIRRSPLYILINEGKAFAQLHLDSKQLMDAKDNAITDLSDEAGRILLDHIPDLSDEDKYFIMSRCDKSGDIGGEWVDALEKKLKEIDKQYTFRKEVFADFNMDSYEDGHMSYNGGVVFSVSRELFLIDPDDIDWDVRRKIENDVGCPGQMEIHTNYKDKTKVDFQFYFDDYELRGDSSYKNDEGEKYEEFLDDVKSYIEEEYTKFRKNLFDSLKSHGIISGNNSIENMDWTNELHNFKLDEDEFDKTGEIILTSVEYEIAKINTNVLRHSSVKKVYNGNGSRLEMDFSQIEAIFEKFIRDKSLERLRKHKTDRSLFDDVPGYEKSKVPHNHIFLRKLPKVEIVVIATDRYPFSSDEEDENGVHKLMMNVILKANVHEHDARVINGFIAKAKLIDKNMHSLVVQAKDVFNKSIMPQIK